MTSIHLADSIKEFNPMFYEDPIQIDSIISQSEIAKRISIPVANGERMHSIWEFRELLNHGGPQYVRPDVGLAGVSRNKENCFNCRVLSFCSGYA